MFRLMIDLRTKNCVVSIYDAVLSIDDNVFVYDDVFVDDNVSTDVVGSII